jgi:hypothetical protein
MVVVDADEVDGVTLTEYVGAMAGHSSGRAVGRQPAALERQRQHGLGGHCRSIGTGAKTDPMSDRFNYAPDRRRPGVV